MAKRRRTRAVDEEEGFLDTLLFRYGTKLALGVLIVVVFLTLVQCTVKTPEAPEWNTTLTVPVINRTYPMEELIRRIDQDGVGIDADSTVIYSITYDVDTVRIDNDNLTVDDISYTTSDSLGPVDIDPPVIAPVSTSISSIIPLATGGVVPEADFSVQHAMPTISNFTTADISSGQMNVIVGNYLGVDLSTVDLEVYDLVNNTSVTTQSIPGGLLDGTTDTVVVPLAGQTLSNSLEVRVSCHNQADTILSTANKEIVTSVEFPGGLTVSSAHAEVPSLSPVSFSEQQTLDYAGGSSEIVYRGSLSGGNLNLSISNNTPLDATLNITIPDIVTPGGTPLSVNQPVSAMAQTNLAIDLTGYEVLPVDSTIPQQVSLNAVATIPGSGGQLVDVSQSDNFSLTAALSGLSFDEVTGVFETRNASFDPFVENVDIPYGFEGVQLVSTILTVDIVNDVNLPGQFDVVLSDGAGRTLPVSGQIAPGTVDSPVVTTIVVVDSGFLSPVPDSIIFSGAATFGDGVTQGTITSDDFVFAHVTLTAPMEMILSETTFDSDIESESINQDDIDLITDHVTEARFVYTITNHLPVGVRLKVLLGADTTTLTAGDNTVIPQLTLGEDGDMEVLAAPTIAGIVPPDSVTVTGYRTIYLDSTDIQILKNDPLFIGHEVTLLSSDGLPVKLTNNDYITVTGRIEVQYHFDGDL